MRSHKFFSVFLLSAITIMISVAFIFWGIGPRDNPAIQYVAQIEDERIMLEEYYRAYDMEYRRIRDQYSDEEIDNMNLPDRVINSLIDRRVLLIAAERAGITVSEKELQNVIINNPLFQRDGVFDANVYERRLKLNRLTPQAYEDIIKKDLIISKMSNMIGETTEISPEEKKMLDSIEGDSQAQLAKIFKDSKSSQSIQAYIGSLKRQMDITVKRELIL